MILQVFMNAELAGTLSVTQGRFAFQYVSDYTHKDGIPLSVSMPCRQEPYPDSVAFPFFENLLPEGNARHLAAHAVNIDYQAVHSLLAKFGGDVAGAITLSPDETTITKQVASLPLSGVEACDLLHNLPRHLSQTASKAGQRLSLAGAMVKLPVIIKNDQWFLPGSAPSTHIVKPEPEQFTGLAVNEFLCMKTAARLNLRAAEVALRTFPDQSTALVVRRFDRSPDNQRLHQEDFCQALGLVSGAKYQADNGPAASQLYAAVRKHSTVPAKDLTELFKRQVLNLLLGNADAHAKNFSFLHLPSSTLLTPTYDIVCTAIYPQLSTALAMEFGGVSLVSQITEDNFRKAAEEAGMNYTALKPSARTIASKVLEAFDYEVKVNDLPANTEETITAMRQVIEQNQRAILNALQ